MALVLSKAFSSEVGTGSREKKRVKRQSRSQA
jgi:hypothetical protein